MVESVVQSHAEIVVSSAEKPKIRVLHVDDEHALLKVAKQCLELQGPFHVETAGSVEEALARLQIEQHDAVVSDYQMPGKDGLAFLKELRQKGNGVPFIMFTGKGREEVAIEALNLGADQYINKTGDPATVYCELAHAIRKTVERKRAQEEKIATQTALKTCGENYGRLFDSTIEGIIINGSDGRISSLNPAAAKILGYSSPKELVGTSMVELYADPDDRACILQELKKNGCVRDHVMTWKKKDGAPIEIEASVTVQKDEKGNLLRVEGMIRDVSERKRSERFLRESEEKYRELAEGISDVFFAMDKNLRYTYWNKASEKLTGIKAKDAIGKSLTEVFPDVKGTKVEQFYRSVIETKQHQTFVNEYQVGDEDFIFELNAYATKDGLSVFVKDITERKKTEEAVRLSEEKYKGLFENSRDAIVLLDLKGNVTSINKAAEEYGFNKSEILGKNMLKFIYKRYWPKLLKDVAQVALGKTAEGRIEIRTPKGDKMAEYRGNPIFSGNRVVGIQAILEDTTERKRAEEVLRENEEKFRAVVNSAAEGVITIDDNLKIVFWNDAAETVFGYSAEEMIGKPITTVLSPASRMNDEARMKEWFLSGEVGIKRSIEVCGVRKDGSEFPEEISYSLWKTKERSFITGIVRDTTERKKSEELLRESEERSRGLFESIQDPVGIFVGREGRLIDYNAAFKRSSGYTDEELKGKVFLDFVHPDDHALVLEKYQTEYSEKEFPLAYEIRGMNKKGESLPLEISVSQYKKKGRAIGIEVIHRDITERKRYERSLSALNAYGGDLNMAESMEEICRLTLDAMQKVLGFEYADFFMIDKSVLCIVDQRGYPEPFPLELPLDGSKKGITIKVAKTGNSVIVRDVRENTDFVEGLPGILSELAVPIKVGQKTLGVLNVEDKRLSAFDEKDQELLEILASHAATAITNLGYATNLETYATEIRESQQKFERLFMDNPEAAVYLDANFKIVDVNPCFCQLFGYSAEEVKGKNINDFVVPEGKREEAEGLDKDAKNGYASHNTVRKRKDGSLVPVSISAAPVTFENKLLGYIGIYKNITELKRAQEESEESKKQFHMLFDLMADPVAVVDGRGKILEVTRKVEEITGFKKEELVGKNLLKIKMFGAKTKAVMIKKLAERMMGMHLEPYEVEVLKKDGGKLIYEINAAKISYKGKPADLVVFRDVLERKNLEEKLRVVGSLTRHDVRNKLSAVTGNAYLLKRKLAGNPEALEQLADMENAVRNVEVIFEFAGTYEKLGVEQLVNMNVGKAVDEAASLFTDLKGIRIVNECGGLTVLADSFLRQLFYNLIDDSLKYGEKLTQIRIRYEEFEDKLKLIYEDDGVGMSKDAKAKLFIEGFTTGKGSGYGLYLIRRMMDVYGWTINETGMHGKGAQFTINIPKAKSDGRQNYKLS